MHERDGGAHYAIHVYRGTDLRAVAGANTGDGIHEIDELAAGDLYRLSAAGPPGRLLIDDGGKTAREPEAALMLTGEPETLRIAQGSEVGDPGAAISLAARLTILAEDGHSVDVMVLETTSSGGAPFLFAFGPLLAATDYTLVDVALPQDLPSEALRLIDVAPFGFVSGTQIMMADGTQRRVETLVEGDLVRTRDNGAQPLRQVLRQTLRAVPPNAPVVLPAETFGNPEDLVLSPHQRLLIYQREDRLTDTAELLLRAADLCDGETVFVREGGFVDYITLVLETHEMVFAECVAVESLEVSQTLRHRLGEDHARALDGLSHAPHYGTEAGREVAAVARERLLSRKG